MTALLAVDVGNTNTVLGVFRDGELAAHWRIQTVAARTADEYAVLIKTLLDMNGFPWRTIDERSESWGRGPAGSAGGEGVRPLSIDRIVEIGRRTRTQPSRSLWIAAIVVGILAAAGFAVAMLAEPAPTERPDRVPDGSGLLTGLVIGAAVGIVIGYSMARQRRDHSSRNSP